MHLGSAGVTIHTLFAGQLVANILFRWSELQNQLKGKGPKVRQEKEYKFVMWQTVQILENLCHPIWWYWYFEEPIKEDAMSHYGHCVLFTLDILNTYYNVDRNTFLRNHEVMVCTMSGSIIRFEMSPLATVEHLLFKLVTQANLAEHVNKLSLWDTTSNQLNPSNLIAEYCDIHKKRPIEFTVIVGEWTSMDKQFYLCPDWNIYDGDKDILHTAGGAVCLQCNQLLHLDEITFWSFYDLQETRTDMAVCSHCDEAAIMPWWMFSTFECMRHKEVQCIQVRALSFISSVHEARFEWGRWEKW